MRAITLTVLAILFLAGCASPAALKQASAPVGGLASATHALAPMTFLAPVDTDKVTRGSEPSVAVAADGTIYVSAPSLVMDTIFGAPGGPTKTHSVVWVSHDHGATFARTGDVVNGQNADYSGGGDSDIAVDAAGRVYMADLGAGVPVITSLDSGKTWNLTPNAASGNTTDREWIVGGKAGEAFLAYENSSAEGGQYLEFTNSSDGGATWRTPATWVAPLHFPESYHGPIQLDQERRILYVPFSLRGGMAMAVSHDGGLTFEVQTVATGLAERPGMLLPTAGVDRAGNVYVAWSEEGQAGWSIYYAWAPPGGGNWSKPHAVTPGGDNVMPALVAGADGRIAIAFYQSALYVGPPDGPQASGAIWNLVVAHTLDAKAAMPEFHEDTVMTRAHVGSICSFGSFCFLGPAVGRPDKLADRSLGDFFKAALTPDGKLVVAFDHDDPLPWTQADTAAVAVQSGGDSLA